MVWKRLRDRRKGLPSPKTREPTQFHPGPTYLFFRGKWFRGIPAALTSTWVLIFAAAVAFKSSHPELFLVFLLILAVFGIVSALIVRRLEPKHWSWLFFAMIILLFLAWIWHDPNLIPLFAGFLVLIVLSAVAIHLIKRLTAPADWRKGLDD